MKQRTLGPFSVSAIGLGCMNLSHAYGVPVSAEQGERVLLQSTGFASPRDAGQRIASIKLGEIGDGASDFALGDGVTDEEVNAALAAFVAAQLEGEAGKA